MPDDGRPPPARGSDFVIREARSADIDALARLEAECFVSDRLSRRSLAALGKSPSACVLIAHRGGQAIGYAALLTRRGGRSARLYSIAVAAEEAGRGVGSSLLEAVEVEALARGAERVHLEVRADNPAAQTFYERAGYRQTGQRPGYYEDGMTALLLARNLSPSALSTTRSRRLSRAA